MTLQNSVDARLNSTLAQRFGAQLLSISDDIIGEGDLVDHHYLRRLIIHFVLYDRNVGSKIAQGMLDKALAQGALTLPILEDVEQQQTTPDDTEIVNSVNGFMATPSILFEILSNIL